jgi:YVTN family beta-propeller protein
MRALFPGVALAVALGACASSTAPQPGHPGTAFSAFPLSGGPWNVAISRQGLAYVTRVATDSVTRVDLASNRAAGSLKVGNGPYDVTFNSAGTLAYVTNLYDGTVSVITTATGTEDTTFAVPGEPVRILLGPSEHKLYVTLADGGLAVLNAQSGAVTTTLRLGLAALNGLALTTDPGGDVSEINTVTDTVTRSFALGGTPQDAIVAPGDTLLYVADEAGWVTVWSLTAWAARDSIPVPWAFGLALSPDGTQLWVAQAMAGSISVIDCASRTVVDTLPVLGQPRHLAMTPNGAAVVVANETGLVQIGR